MLNILRWNGSLCNFNGHRIWFYECAQTGMGFNMEPLKAKNQLEDPTINLLAFSNDDYLNVMLKWSGLCLYYYPVSFTATVGLLVDIEKNAVQV